MCCLTWITSSDTFCCFSSSGLSAAIILDSTGFPSHSQPLTKPLTLGPLSSHQPQSALSPSKSSSSPTPFHKFSPTVSSSKLAAAVTGSSKPFLISSIMGIREPPLQHHQTSNATSGAVQERHSIRFHQQVMCISYHAQ